MASALFKNLLELKISCKILIKVFTYSIVYYINVFAVFFKVRALINDL